MSLITRCPACTTLFKVVPDQLRISEGWVRCGQCDEVFDANVHLQGGAQALVEDPTHTDTRESAGTSMPAEQPFVAPDAPVAASEPDPEILVDFSADEPAEPTPEQALSAQLDWPEEAAFERDPLFDVRPGESFQEAPPLSLDLPGDGYALDAPGDEVTLVEPLPEWDVSGVDDLPTFRAPADATESSAAREPVEHQRELESQDVPMRDVRPSFLREAKPPSVWSRPWVRRSLVLVSVGLVVTLTLQMLVNERDRLAANFPDARPVLVAMCSALGCQLSAYRQIDSVAIESSAFVKLRGDVYRLNITLKNTAQINIAAPAVELTLTDSQEQPMMRKVLLADDLGAVGGSLLAGSELTASVPVHVKSNSPSDRIIGYRLLAFYP